MLFSLRSSNHLPPGPPGLPIVGNLRDIPSSDQWLYFDQQSKKYGSDITSYRVLNKTIIVLNSKQAIDALFTNNLAHYSSKPPRRMSEISDLTMTLPFMDPGNVFSNARQQFHAGIGLAAVRQYDRDYDRASREFMQTLANDLHCAHLDNNIDASLGRVFLKVSTGYSGAETDAVCTQMNELAHFAADVLGDKYQIFDIVPFLSALPTWVPTVGPMLRLGAQWKTRLHATAQRTLALSTAAAAQGAPSVMSHVLGAAPGAAATPADDQAKMIAVTMNAGGMLATESATLTFLLAMARFPAVQRRAQAEVDAVCGAGRLPTMADRARLPYVDAVLSEVLRWVSIAPIVARRATEDDHYNGFLIPKGATVMANSWAISRDESVYPDPAAFRPERFLRSVSSTPGASAEAQEEAQTGLGQTTAQTEHVALRTDVLHPMAYAFGFGHRTCPGRFLADALLFSHFAHVLRVFDVSLPAAVPTSDGKGVKEEGVEEKRERDADARMKVKSNGAACRVEEVYVTLALRSPAAAALIDPTQTQTQNAPQANGEAIANGHANGYPNGDAPVAH